jgi:2-amino-4-hydroxy-6-hydroxymethyldihydropteridine diphosphokinase
MKGKYLILGSNVGSRAMYLQAARDKIVESIGPVLRSSSIYQTDPWGYLDQAPFYNQIVQFETILDAVETLKTLLAIEKSIGRIRQGKWKERIIDIDILYFEDQIINSENLTIPHPGIPYRRFILVPLCELIPDEIHPLLKVSNANLLKTTNDILGVEKIIIRSETG